MTALGTCKAAWSRRPIAHAAGLALLLVAGPAAAQAPGAFEVDEEAAERALERALVETGSVILPPRSAEVVPFFSYARQERDGATRFIGVDEDDDAVFSSVRRRSDDFAAGITLRTGLPWNGQVELTVPFSHVSVDDTERVGAAVFGFDEDSASGLGDVALTYTQALREEGGGLPTILASLSWDSDTGREEDGIFTGSGFHEIGVALTATQRQDPLVFSGRIGYARSLEENDVRPGDELSFAAGAFLAVNPETSLQFSFDLAYADDTEVNGDAIDGSDQLAASLNLGVASILRRSTFVSAVLSVGLTEDAPDFGVSLSVPIRFTY